MRITIELGRPRLSRRAAALLTAVALAVPTAVVASHQFADVPDSNPFHADIAAIADAGVTSGCGDDNYCPSSAVTREQMAAFMNRLGALGPGKTPVVNAAKLDGLDSTDLMPRARYTVSAEVDVTASFNGGTTAACDEGDALLAGGHSGVALASHLEFSLPSLNLEGWQVSVSNYGSVTDTVEVVALCADAAPLHVEPAGQ